MNMLIYFSMHKIPFRIIPIETIYLEENKSSHFHPLRDSWRIYKLLLGSFLRFSAAAIVSLLVDYAVLSLLMLLWHDMDTVVLPVFGLLFQRQGAHCHAHCPPVLGPMQFPAEQEFLL